MTKDLRDTISRCVAAELRAESARRQVRQVHVAQALGLVQSTVSERYRGKVPLTVDQFVAWCRLLDLDPAAVLASALRAAHDNWT